MFFGFGVAGAADAMSRRDLIFENASLAALIFALCNEALLFLGHPAPKALENRLHTFIICFAAGSAASAGLAISGAQRMWPMIWYCMVMQGAVFLETAMWFHWKLEMDHKQIMKGHVVLSFTMICVGILFAVRLSLASSSKLGRGGSAPMNKVRYNSDIDSEAAVVIGCTSNGD